MEVYNLYKSCEEHFFKDYYLHLTFFIFSLSECAPFGAHSVVKK